MMATDERIKYLFKRFVEKNCSKEELQELYAQVNQTGDSILHELMDAHYENLKPGPGAEQVDWEPMFQQIIKEQVTAPFHKPTWRRIAVAASIILTLGIGSYFLFFNKGGNENEIAGITAPAKDVEAPKVTKAMITLANGQQVLLDSLTTLSQGSVNIEKTKDGQIVYNGSSAILKYNVMVNPRGSKVQPLTLNDGTKVWLNAESSIQFPTAFIGNERSVEITGECYFEVTHDATKPFTVKDINRGTAIQVLGTHFNVNTYADEPIMKVTLLEGSVKVIKGSSSGLLKPGQQAQVSHDIKVVDAVNVVEVMAWKNGYFQFTNADIGTVMRQVERWYDVQVVYEGEKPTGHYAGEVSRNVSAAEMLKVIKASGVNFRIEGKKIIVMK